MKIVIIILLILFLFNCKRQSSVIWSKSEIIDITEGLNQKGTDIKLSEVCNEIQYCFLETSDECLIDKIDKIMIDDSLIFIYNKHQFFIFNLSGKFKRKIGKLGKGPGEFLRIMDFTINNNKNLIFIYDSDQQKIICYDYKGFFKFEFKIGSYPTRIACINHDFLILSYVLPDFIANENYGFSKFDMQGNLINKFFDRSSEDAKTSMSSTFLARLNHYCDSLTYWEINLDVIFRLDKGKLIPRYTVDYESNNSAKDMNVISENIFRYSYFIETKKYLFFLRGIYNEKIKHLMYNKDTKEIKNVLFPTKDLNLMLRTGFINDIDGGFPFLPYDALENGRLYCTFYPYELKNLVENNIYGNIKIQNQKQQEQLYQRIKNSKTLDNPIIMFINMD